MPSLKDLRNRIASVKATQKITKAMQMVAAAKLRRAQEAAEAARPYSERMGAVLANITQAINLFMPLSLQAPETGADASEPPRGGRRARFQEGARALYQSRRSGERAGATATWAKGEFRPTAGVPPGASLAQNSCVVGERGHSWASAFSSCSCW